MTLAIIKQKCNSYYYYNTIVGSQYRSTHFPPFFLELVKHQEEAQRP